MAVIPMSPPSDSLVPAASMVRDRLLADLKASDAGTLKRELHDTVLQDVLYIAMELTRIEAEEGETSDDPARLARVAREAYQKFREVLGNGAVQDEDAETLWSLVRRQCDWFKDRTGQEIDVAWRARGDGTVLTPPMSHNLGRIIHEALWNAWVHANATHIRLKVEQGGQGVAISIIDDGDGFASEDIPESHYGLANMAERAELIGARFRVQSRRGGGTTVRIMLSGTDSTHGGRLCRSQLSLSTTTA